MLKMMVNDDRLARFFFLSGIERLLCSSSLARNRALLCGVRRAPRGFCKLLCGRGLRDGKV